MQKEQKSFRTFEDLEVYQVAREFRKAMYRLANLDAILNDATVQRFNDSTVQP